MRFSRLPQTLVIVVLLAAGAAMWAVSIRIAGHPYASRDLALTSAMAATLTLAGAAAWVLRALRVRDANRELLIRTLAAAIRPAAAAAPPALVVPLHRVPAQTLPLPRADPDWDWDREGFPRARR